jgi:putative membrane protein
MRPLLTPELNAALVEAVCDIERRSCAEVVVEVRSRSGSYAHAESRFTALVAFAALLLLLFSPWPFAAYWVAIDVAAMYGIALFIARRSDVVRRWFSRKAERETQVRTTAAAVFHERGVANTSGETGVLVFLSVLEQRVEVLADRGVLLAVPALPWNVLVERARGCPGTVPALLDFLRTLAPLLGEYLPVREGDVDELANEPRFSAE